MIKDIRIEWDGPYTLQDIGYIENHCYNGASLLNEVNKDVGIYQVYGNHPIYGNNVLLYIGQAFKQTFALRLSQEAWEYNSDYKNIKFYVGRLFGDKKVDDNNWKNMIDIAEKMLIHAHSPAKNSQHILNISRDENKLQEFENIRIFNYDNYRSLMPEVSGELWIKEFDNFNGVFGSKEFENN